MAHPFLSEFSNNQAPWKFDWKTQWANLNFSKPIEVCNFSGFLGPKLKEGDNQSPEGFYFVYTDRLNPWSQYHLAFNLGYPNAYDRFHGRTGSALMVHGDCVPIGCYAMTNEYINEIYTLAVAALLLGQSFFRVHIFPFKLEDNILVKHREKNCIRSGNISSKLMII